MLTSLHQKQNSMQKLQTTVQADPFPALVSALYGK